MIISGHTAVLSVQGTSEVTKGAPTGKQEREPPDLWRDDSYKVREACQRRQTHHKVNEKTQKNEGRMPLTRPHEQSDKDYKCCEYI